MKNKFLVASMLVIVSAFAVNVYAVGQNSDSGTGSQIQQQTQTANQGEDNQVQVQNSDQAQGETSNQAQSQNQNQEQNTSTAGQQGQITSEQHRSVVAGFVQSLLQVADREGGIGEQVRTIAQQQNQSASTTIQAMEKVQTRSRVKTFFFGSDYKNLGSLRSEMVQTENRLEQLNVVMENVQNEGDKTEIQSQIQTLEQEQIKIENFIKAQEGKFSLFGWLVKLFN
ncbi:MAG: hypothetical protein A2175_00315 [Candidatus Nealsonbacteria bacterium RBG_13_42_11]|uniref:DUF5667 domain-containing protein n=1 Tax=Candidatus Nealsonbacteria bacterium RBG_13_42_11 TaxID=1801663 RepID=A0A1G2E0N6_9BACT|nr:MAG: hypothetical protein A2175_00315 [Candidatus Nealsonbacteria bacterium RBG_13_42_11]